MKEEYLVFTIKRGNYFYDSSRDDWFHKPEPECLLMSEAQAKSALILAKGYYPDAEIVKYKIVPAN